MFLRIFFRFIVVFIISLIFFQNSDVDLRHATAECNEC